MFLLIKLVEPPEVTSDGTKQSRMKFACPGDAFGTAQGPKNADGRDCVSNNVMLLTWSQEVSRSERGSR